MPQFFMNKRLIILLIGIILLVALIGFSLRERDNLSWPEQFVKDTAGFVQQILTKPAQSVAGFVNNVQDLINTYEENKVLKSRLDEYAKLRVEVDRLEKENEELKGIIEKSKDLASYHPLNATVIARDVDRWNDSLYINKGEVHGIRKNMAVITADGMLGKIKSVGKLTSKVQLLTSFDQNNYIHALIQGEENVYGIIAGYDHETNRLLLTEIPADSEIEKGQNVITSGLGGVFPKGLLIGNIDEVKPNSTGLTKIAYLTPAADFYNVEEVIVVERLMELPEEDLVGEE